MTSTSTSSPALTFTHKELTKIPGKPTNTTLKKLKKEVYANARAIPSTRGGGNHGHLGIVMDDAAYLTLAGQAFDLPAHPGPAPVHQANPTAAQIAENNRVYNATLDELKLATNVENAIKNQIVEAVDSLYFDDLEDADFGFANVTIPTMLTHLQDTYGKLTRAELEANRASIATAWNVDMPIQQLWKNLKEVQRVALQGGEEIANKTVIELTVAMFQKTGVFTDACNAWRRKPEANKTMANFKTHFNEENEDRLEKLTAAQAGYHGANSVTPLNGNARPTSDTALAATTTGTSHVIANDGTKMYYCWTHGLGLNENHTSPTCKNKAEGHKDDATVSNMQGGSTTLMTGRRRGQRE